MREGVRKKRLRKEERLKRRGGVRSCGKESCGEGRRGCEIVCERCGRGWRRGEVIEERKEVMEKRMRSGLKKGVERVGVCDKKDERRSAQEGRKG